MWDGIRVLVTGGRGFLGSHLVNRLVELGADPVAVGRAEADLRDREAAVSLVTEVEPTVLIHCAVVGGGIGWMRHHPVESGRDNVVLNLNALDAAHQCGVTTFIGVSSACAYPAEPAMPMVEDDLWKGHPEPTNGPYGLSKRTLMAMGRAYHEQYGLHAVFPILTNLYGPGDCTDEGRAHVVAGLILRCLSQPDELVVWGSGRATREFLYVKDAVDGILAMARSASPQPLNVGTGEEVSIHQLATEIAAACDYRGALRFDDTKPDGMARKCLDVTRIREAVGWEASTSRQEGLRETVAWYRSVLSPC